MKQISPKRMLTGILLLTGTTMMAQETVELVSTRPMEGAVTTTGSITLNFNLVPSVNSSCTETAKFYIGDKEESSVKSTSYYVQMGTEGMAETEVTISFTKAPIRETGDYKITIPEGFFTFANGTLQNPEYEFNFNIPSPMTMYVSPSPGYYTAVPNNFIIQIPGAKEIKINKLEKDSDGLGVIYFDTQEELYTLADETLEVFSVGNRVFINVPHNDSFTMPYLYDLSLPVGALTVTFEDGTVKDSSAKLYRYIIPRIPFPSILPEEGKYTSIKDLTIYFPEEDDITFDRFLATPSIYKTNDAGEATERVASFDMVTPATEVKGKRALNFSLNSIFDAPGKYKIKIGRSSFVANGYFEFEGEFQKGSAWNNCDYYYDLTIVESTALIQTPEGDVENKVKELSTVTMYMPNTTLDNVSINPDVKKPYIADDFDRQLTQYQVEIELSSSPLYSHSQDAFRRAEGDKEGVWVNATITPAITAPGYYTLYIPTGYLQTSDGSKSPIYYREFQVDPSVSMEGVNLNDALVNVYSIEGVCVARGIKSTALTDLPKGLYIVNGRKLVIK